MADVSEISDDDLLGRAVKSCRANARKGHPHPRCAAVMQTFLLGSTYAAQLCRRYDLDPNEPVKR